MNPSVQQLRAARAWLGWSHTETASFCNIPAAALAHAERGAEGADPRVLASLRFCYEKYGLRFLGLEGIGRGLD